MAVIFWRTPRKTAARRWIFQIHFWAGLIAGVMWLVVGLTGSAVVFVPELRRLEVPDSTRVQPAGQALPIETLVHRVQKERPTDRMHSIYWDFKPTWGLNFRSVAANGDRIHSFIDQYRGTLLGSVDYNHSALQWIYDLHSDLQGGDTGRAVNAWFGFALAIVSTSGLLLWWRGKRQWKLGLEYRAKASWKRQVWDMHNLGGFLFYFPLLLLSLSGTYYAYESGYAWIVERLTGGPAVIQPPRTADSRAPRRSLDEIQASALRAIPDASPSMMIFPARPGEPFTLRVRRPLRPSSHRAELDICRSVHSAGPACRPFRSTAIGSQDRSSDTPLHYGTIGGIATRVLWVIAGLMPGVSFVTSLLMWWNRSLSKKRRRPRGQPAVELQNVTAVHR